jgi:PmbA protein
VVVGYLIENGEIKKPVKGIMISGNFHHIIKHEIELIGNDVTNVGGIYAPTIKIAEMTIAGKT